MRNLKMQLVNKIRGNPHKEIQRLDRRINKLKQLTLPKGKSRLANPFYDNFRMFTYYVDNEFSMEQKKWFIEKQCTRALGYFPNLDEPQSFNEKTQWYKLNYQDDLITDCIDKYRFKDHVDKVVGKNYGVPLLGAWDNAREIDFETLPDRFVLKSNWGSGSRHVLLVQDKTMLNIDHTRLKLNTWIQPWENVYYHTFDWGYKNIKPKIIAEQFMKKKKFEYKFFCFNGEPAYFYVANDSSPGLKNKKDYFDLDWHLLPFTKGAKNFDSQLLEPNNFSEMISLCKVLSKPFPHVRVDLVDTEDGLVVEELTFYTSSGTGKFNPVEWDYKFGEAFILPDLINNRLRPAVYMRWSPKTGQCVKL